MRFTKRLLNTALSLAMITGSVNIPILASNPEVLELSPEEEAINAVRQAVFEAVDAPGGVNDTLNSGAAGCAKLSYDLKYPEEVNCSFLNPEQPAMSLLTVEFLSKLFAYQEITSMTLLDIQENNYLDQYIEETSSNEELKNDIIYQLITGVYTQLKTPAFNYAIPIAHEDTQQEQMFLMLSVLISVMCRYPDLAKNFIEGVGTSATIGFLSETNVPITLDGCKEVAEGDPITYHVPLTVYFFNQDQPHNLTFSGEGIIDSGPVEKTFGEAIDFPAVSRDGYDLIGWNKYYTNPEEGTLLSLEATAEEKMPGRNVTYSPVWKAKQINIKFNFNDDQTQETTISQTYDTDWKLPSVPERPGYKFLGWSASSNGSGNLINTSGKFQLTQEATLYAIWHQYPIVTFESEGMESVTRQADDQNVVTPIEAIDRPGYEFQGWFEEGAEQQFDFTNVTKSTTVKAKWKATTYSVKYENDKGVNPSENPTSYTIEDEDKPIKDLEAEGYTFKGWTLTVTDGPGNEDITEPQTNLKIAQGSYGNRVYTAQWEAREFDITYDYQDGTDHKEVKKQKYDQPWDIPDNPTREGYKFAGWYTDQTGGTPVTKQETFMGTSNTTIYAHWTHNAVVTFKDGDKDWGTRTADENGKVDDLPTAVKDGYKFDGWYKDGQPFSFENVQDDTEVEAKWTPVEYSIKFTQEEGAQNPNSEQTYNIEEGPISLKAPSKTGYVFKGWDITVEDGLKPELQNGSEAGEYLIPKGSYGNLTLKPVWEAKKVTVTFHTNKDQDEETALEQTYDDKWNLPENPAWKDHDFLGWSEQKQDGELVDTSETFQKTENFNLYAKWRAYPVITFMDGQENLGDVTADSRGKVIPHEDLQKNGYTFKGWYEAGKEAEQPFNFDEVKESATVEARWEKITYDITYKLQDGVEDPGNPKSYDVESQDITFKAPSRTGYTFKGWIVDVSQDGAQELKRLEPDKNFVVKTGSYGKLTLTPSWTPITYTIKFVGPDGIEEQEVFYDDFSTPLRTNTFEKEGYTFKCWTDKDNHEYADGATLSENLSSVAGEEITLTAQWEANSYQVEFLPGANDAQGSMNLQDFVYDQAQKLTQNAFTRKGYEFDGWKSGEKSYSDGQEVSNLTSQNDDKVQLVAQWKGNTYSVYLNADGGELPDGNEIKVIYGQPYGEALPKPARAGYDFVQWETEDGNVVGSETIVGQGLDVMQETPTLKAKWNRLGNIDYRIEYYQQNVNDNNYTLKEREDKKGETDSLITVEEKVYPGFHINKGTSELNKNVSGDGKTVVKVYYDRDEYNVKWVVDDKEQSESYRYEATPACPLDLVKEGNENFGYRFDKWNSDSGEIEGELPKVTGNVTYTAEFREYHEARIGETTYRTLQIALNKAAQGQDKLVVLDDDVVLEEDMTVPEGVMLLLPVSDGDTGYNEKTGFNPDGSSFTNKTGLDPQASLFHTLTIPQGTELTVNGTVLVNAVTGRKATTGYDQDTTGGYSQIDLQGKITVNKGGLLDSCGYIKGKGEILAKSGAEVRDLYIVKNWRGGSQAFDLFPTVYPMNEVDMHHIQTKTTIEAGASLYGTVKMYALSSYYYTRFPQIDPDNGLIQQTSGSVIKSYDETTGREKLVLNGTGTISASTLFIVALNLSTGSFVFPIDGDMDFEVNGTWNVQERLKFMPGANVTVKSGSLILDKTTELEQEDNEIVFYEEFNDPFYNVPLRYPDDRGPAALIISAGTSTTINSAFGGNIKVDRSATESNPAMLTLASDAPTTVLTKEVNTQGAEIRALTTTAKIEGQALEQGYTYLCWYDEEGELHISKSPSSSLKLLKAEYDGKAHAYSLEGITSGIEYLYPGSEEWTSSQPSKVGIYQVRYLKEGKYAYVPNGLEITPRTVQVSASGSISKEYDGRVSVPAGSNLTLSLNKSNVLAGEEVELSTSNVSYAFESATAGTNKKILIRGLSLTGKDAANYSLPSEISANLGTITGGSSSSGGSFSGGSGGGSGSSSSSGSSSAPAEPSQSDTVTNSDGSTTTTTTDGAGNKTTTTEKTDGSTEVVEEKVDGSTITTTTNADGSSEKVEEKADGSKTTTTDDGAGTTQIKEEKVDGSVETTTSKADGSVEKVEESADKLTTTTTNTDAAGTTSQITETKSDQGSSSAIQGSISVSEETVKQAASTGSNVTITMPEIPADHVGNDVQLEVVIPESAKSATLEIPVDTSTIEPGSVAMMEDEEGNLTPIVESIGKDGKLIVPLSKNCKIVIKDNKKNFADVTGPISDYPANGIAFLSARNLMTGVGDGINFDLTGKVTRAQLATILYRYNGEPDTSKMALPAGAEDNVYYSKAARWATNTGLMGVGSNFNAGDLLTREQLAMILWRVEGKPNDYSLDFSKYADASSISTPEMQRAVGWAVKSGLMGKGTPKLNASGSSQRQELAAMLSRYLMK